MSEPRRIIHALRRDTARTYCGLSRPPLLAGTLIAEDWRMCRRCARSAAGMVWLYLDGDRRVIHAGGHPTAHPTTPILTIARVL